MLLCGFAFGPVAGVLTEFLKIVIKLFFKPTSTAFVGELANFCVGCAMILPATIIYHMKKKKTTALLASAVGTMTMTVFGTLFNAVYLLPTFGLECRLRFCVAPLNLLKGAGVSVLTFVLYKPLSPILKASYENAASKKTKQA